MPYFLSENNLSVGRMVSVAGEEANHILLARRAKLGDELKVQGPDGRRFLATISQIKKHEVVVDPREEIRVPDEPAVKITLFQSVVASGTLDAILQKATELGAAEIVLFNSQFTATRLSSEKFADKLPRFQKILWEAAKQSERGRPPIISFADDLSGVIKRAADLDQVIVFDITGGKLPVAGGKSRVGIVVGPEGGLSQQEISQFQSISQFQLASLGSILLKADTAAIAALALVNNL